jgi:hypothetical protein
MLAHALTTLLAAAAALENEGDSARLRASASALASEVRAQAQILRSIISAESRTDHSCAAQSGTFAQLRDLKMVVA